MAGSHSVHILSAEVEDIAAFAVLSIRLGFDQVVPDEYCSALPSVAAAKVVNQIDSAERFGVLIVGVAEETID